MAKFVFKMQNILAVKEKLESQAKAEYGLEISKLREEEQKKILLEQKKLYYEQQLTECLHDTLDMPRIKQYEQAVEDMKICIREQQHIIKQQEEKVAKARKKLDDAMKERKTYEKLKERAFEEFKLELNAAEQKEVDKKIKGIDQPESAGSKLVTALIALIIIIIWLVVFAFLIKLDVGGIGSNVLYPVLKDVPLVNKILPSVSEEQQAEEGNYKYTTLKSANARIEELEGQLASESGTTSANSDYIKNLEAKVKQLQKYKDDVDAFNKRVAEFDEKVVFTDNAPDASEYRKYYEEISPDNAEKIYRQVVKSERSTEKAKELATYYSNMEAASAAQTLQEMKEDLDLVCDIIENMPEKKAAAILQEMDSTFAAQISKKISAIDK